MEISMEIFMGLVLIIGLILSVYAFKIDAKIAKCVDTGKSVTKASKGLIVLSVSMVAAAVTYLAGGCDSSSSKQAIGVIFLGLLCGLGIVVVVLASIIRSKCSADDDDAKAAKSDSDVLIILGVLAAMSSGGYLAMELHKKVKST